MNKNEWTKWVSVVGRMLLAYALVFAQGAWAAQNQGTKDKPASPQKAAAHQTNEKQSSAASAKAQTTQAQGEESESAITREKSSDGGHEGIKVHGHWTIEVHNPDGTLATHREFENSLLPTGAAYFATCSVSGCAQVAWTIRVKAGTTALSICPGTGVDQAGVCDISATASASQSGSFILNGSLTAAGPGSISFVKSGNNVTGIGFTGTGGELGLTLATLSAPVQVAGGQILQVTVLISFS